MMVASRSMLVVLLFSCLPSVASAQNMRGFDSDVVRKLASSGPSCYSWCSHGHCSWSWYAFTPFCQCICEGNYEGACCSNMMLCGPEKDACRQDMLTPKTVEIN